MNVTQRYSILITDDDRACREALREIMEPQGFRTLLASCGEEALDIVQDEEVHLALLDMHMPTHDRARGAEAWCGRCASCCRSSW